MTTQKQATRWMLLRLTEDPNDPQWIDPITGETNVTRLAEDCAEHFDAYVDQVDWEIPDYIWDAAIDAAEVWEERKEES